jgi:hypothetical protein
MIFWKKSPNSLFVKLNMYVPFTSGQLCPKFCATSVIIKELLKENNHPIGEPLPKLVTLLLVRQTRVHVKNSNTHA